MNPNQPHHELQWDALRFVLDEMSEDEQSAFELLLAEDQAAREAVADAVRQTRLVCLAEDSTVTKPTATVLARSQPWMKVAATLAAVSAVALVCVVFARLNSSPTSPTATDDSESPALAVVWSERALSDDNEAADEDSSLAEWPQDVELPGEESWILTAVFEMQPEMPNEEEGDEWEDS